MEPRLKTEIVALEHTLRRTQFWRALAGGWLVAGTLAVLLLLVQISSGWISQIQWLAPLIVAFIATVIAWRRNSRHRFDSRNVVSEIEREHPEMRHLLSAAAEQEPDPASNEFRYLQLRVVDEVLQHPGRAVWTEKFESKLAAAKRKALVAASAILVLLLALGHSSRHARALFAFQREEITVTPGDTEVERGTSLVISARFGRETPAEATLVLLTTSGKTRYIPLERHLADPVFGASLNEVTEGGIYHIEYAGRKTRDYKISVFDYPALVRADAHLHFPDYTGLTNRMIPDTLRVSAVEGTQLTYVLQLNKPVTRARLVSGNRTLDLQVTNNAIAVLNQFPLTNNARYSLALEDAQGRTNKFPTDFVLVALTNQRPQLKLVFPRGDQRVSRLQEIQLQGEATGEFGLVKYGIGYTVAGQDPRLVELGQGTTAGQKRSFNYLLPLEKLGVDVDQVVAYFVWADDFGPDGKERHTFSDIFFAEVRPFDEIFRPDPSSGMAGNQGGGQRNPSTELAEMQKEILIATWKLQQEKSPAANSKMP